MDTTIYAAWITLAFVITTTTAAPAEDLMTPFLPSLSDLPPLLELPEFRQLPQLPEFPQMPQPSILNLPQLVVPQLPPLPQLPELSIPQPYLPQLPQPSIPQLPQLPQPSLPEIPSLVTSTDPKERSEQARAVLDEVVSRFPTVIDNAAALIDNPAVQAFLNLRRSAMPQLTNPASSGALQLSDVLSGFPGIGSPRSGAAAVTAPRDASAAASQSTLSTLLESLVSNIRDVAISPLGTANSLFNGAAQLATPLVPTLTTPRISVPFIVWVPNEERLDPNALAEKIKKSVRDQSVFPKEKPNAQVLLNLIGARVLDVRPLHPKPTTTPPPYPADKPNENTKAIPFKEENSRTSFSPVSSSSKRNDKFQRGFDKNALTEAMRPWVTSQTQDASRDPIASRREPSLANSAAGARPTHRFVSPGSLFSGPSNVQVYLRSLEKEPLFDDQGYESRQQA